MEIEVKQRNRRRKRAQRMQQELKETNANKANADESETEDVIPKKPPRPPNRRKKQKELLKEPLCEEDIIEGFSILQFRTYEDLELVVKISAKDGIKRLTEIERPKLEPKAHITNHILVHNNHNGLTLTHDPATSDDSGRASERLTGSSVVSVAPRERDADSSRDRLSDASSRCSSGKGYICDSEGEDDKNSQHDEAESETIENAGETETENMFPASTSASITTGNGNTQKEAIHVENTKTANSPTTKQSKTTNVFRAPQNRKRKIAENENISNISAAIDKLDEVVQKNTRNVDDEFDIFAKHIAVQLRQMPLYDAIICQEQIQTVVRQKRLQLLLVRQSEYRTTLSSVCPPSQYYYHTTPSPAFSPSEYHSSPSPALSNNMDPEHSSSSFSNESCNRQHCGEDSQKSSDILTAALTGVLDLE